MIRTPPPQSFTFAYRLPGFTENYRWLARHHISTYIKQVLGGSVDVCIVMPSQDEFVGLCYRLDLLGCHTDRLYLLINFDAMFKTLPKPPPEPPLLPPLPPPICDFK